LRQLVLLRNFMIVAQIFAILAVDRGFAIPLPPAALTCVTVFLVLFNLGTFWRLQRPWSASELELLGQVVVDIGALALLLYFSGGATNPFAVLFVMPLAISAASLPRRYTWVVAFLILACYSLLYFVHVPLPDSAAPGMWVNYALSAASIAYCAAGLCALLRRRERGLAASRQNDPDADNDCLVLMGALAAGAAHELRSPLTTMAVLVEELRREQDGGERRDRAENLRIVSDQIQACRDILCDLVAYGEDALANDKRVEPVDSFLDETVAKWGRLRPRVKLEFQRTGMHPAPRISTEGSLEQAILNLLNNAADASPHAVEMEYSCDSGNLRILIQDRGPGIPFELAGMLGKPFFTTKHDGGTGIGLRLAKMAVHRAGGSLKLSNRPGGGACAEVVLPLEVDRQCERVGASNDGAVSREKVHFFGGRA
jgi:two-component system sensor histidine kinase RegB